MPPSTKNQDDSNLAQTMRDVAKLEIRVDAFTKELSAVNLKATMALTIQILNLGGVIFIVTKLFDLASRIH